MPRSACTMHAALTVLLAITLAPAALAAACTAAGCKQCAAGSTSKCAACKEGFALLESSAGCSTACPAGYMWARRGAASTCVQCSQSGQACPGGKEKQAVALACGASPGKARSGDSYTNKEKTACMCSRGFVPSPTDMTKCIPDPSGALLLHLLSKRPEG